MAITPEQLYEADKRHEAAITDLQRQLAERAEEIARHEQHLDRLDLLMEEMRASLATREDIRDLRADLRDRFDYYRKRLDDLEQERSEAENVDHIRHSKLMNWAMVGLFVVEVVIAFAQYQWMRGHG